ncbi:TonB-dependent receptor [Thalassotalea insulae]|uniref:TonB-dependent receptor n=1 Tax=Thalassotalea insulae TaxID=2056778 RepID=A0ABQ6GWS5_9GAMM|nr:TonB-dependent receptor [Thalassotalea insulae]GLX80396.1 TonB-dependent receptor [Thalassotalea insulae]
MKIKALTLVISAALCGSVFAADTDTDDNQKKQNEEEVEVIEVTGIISSLKEAQSIKKMADNVVDALVAEDIGKFPDENVAEALQRIPGISVTRSNGEGQTITIRGLTGGYNITSLNGRKLASDNAGRDFNYDVIASELVGKIEVHKTQKAKIQEGAVGGVVNIFTRKPLELGKAMSVSVKADYNERAEATNPKTSFLISDTFDNGELGALLSLVHTKTTSRYDSYWASWWHDNTYSDIGNNVPMPSGSTTDDMFRSPSYPKINMSRSERERIGGTFALQWLPSENLDVNFDGLYTTYDIDVSGKVLSLAMPTAWGPFGEYTEYNVGSDGFLESAAWNDATLELLEDSNPRKSSTYQLGLNVNWIHDQLTLNLDASHSEAENKNDGDTKFVVVRAGVDAAAINFNNGQAIPDIYLSQALDENAKYGAHYSRIDGDNINDTNTRIVIDGSYEFSEGIITELYFGAGYNMQEKDKVHYSPKNGSIFALDYMNAINPTYDAETVVIGGQEMWRLPDNVIIPGNGDNFGGNANVPSSWASIDVDALYQFYQKLDPEAYQEVIPTQVKSGSNSFAVKEETIHAYIEAKIEEQLFGLPYMLDAGVRYIKTDVTSHGYSQDPANLVFGDDGLPANDAWQDRVLVNFTGSYSEILPSFNFKLALTPDVILRLAASKAIARPNLAQLRPITEYNPIISTDADGRSKRSLYENDPGLSPYSAKMFDTALEWYYSETGNLAFASFFKELSAFVKNDITSETIAGKEFQVTRPYNDDENQALIRGYEISWYQTFDEFLPESFAGFGISANYTYNNSSSGEKDGEGQEIPFWGLSKTQSNINLFYEQHGFSANIAYNKRSGFNAYKAWHWTYETFGWVDNEQANATDGESLSISLAYDINKNLRITADGNNLLDPENNISVNAINTEMLAAGASEGRYGLSSASYGRRYSVGVRYKF